MKLFRYGPGRKFVKTAVTLSWPLMVAAKKLSSYPFFKWIINPFFAYPYNEVTAIPINIELRQPENVLMPRRLVERLVSSASDRFILDRCICRDLLKCANHPQNIGCMALGTPVRHIHPSHGRIATAAEAVDHVRRAAGAGLIANIAHTWIDPVAFGLPRFDRLMFICFCDDCCCLYRTHMKKRGPNLDRAYKKLPGISITIDAGRCTGCGICARECFVGAIEMKDGKALIGEDCKGCGRCVDHCAEGAISLWLDGEEELFQNMMARVARVADITSPR